MGNYNFDEIIDRSGTNTIKHEFLQKEFGRTDLLPLWVADMDFLSPPEITAALVERTRKGHFGYTGPSQAYYHAIIQWVRQEHGWNLQEEWITFIPGVVKGIAFVIDCFTQKGDEVIIQPPVYHPFKNIPTLHHRQVVCNPLILHAGQYQMDVEHLKSIITCSTRLFILCNPHNPGGRVWTYDELKDIATICAEQGVLVIADEIHSDLAFNDHKHIPFASVSEQAAQNSITFMAPSKTFNIAGIVSAFAVVPNEVLRNQFFSYLKSSELNEAHLFAYTATEAAYRFGGSWLQELKSYLWENVCFVDHYLKTNIPSIKVIIPQASFLIWLDCRALNLTQAALVAMFINEARLALNDGAMFGEEGRGFMRLNVGCPRSILITALDRLSIAVNSTKKKGD